jgi:hypothetical protein
MGHVLVRLRPSKDMEQGATRATVAEGSRFKDHARGGGVLGPARSSLSHTERPKMTVELVDDTERTTLHTTSRAVWSGAAALSASGSTRMKKGDVEELRDAIRRLHSLEAAWVEVQHVHNYRNRQLVWEGEVHVFSVVHPLASRCFAWVDVDDQRGRRVHAVLQIPAALTIDRAVWNQLYEDEHSKPRGG